VTRLCLIGNSHLSAFRRGWSALPEPPDGITATFFGSLRDTLKLLEIEDGKLVAKAAQLRANLELTSNGLHEIDPAAYDAFVLVGLYVSMKRVNRFYRYHRFFGQTITGTATLLRRQVAVETLLAEFSRTRMAEMSRTLRLLTDKPIYAFAEPFWAASARGPNQKPFPDGASVAQIFNETVAASLEPHNVRFLPQPAETIHDFNQTADEFNIPDWDRKLRPGQSPDDKDYVHMNTAFGVLCWRDLLADLPA
jgi:hypothetical protein